MSISVCIATYRRAERLALVLDDLARQTMLPDEVVVVDNDETGSARPVVDAMQSRGLPFVVRYDIQSERNIALTRNRTVALASGLWVAFIDDDERAPTQWLARLMTAASEFGADGVLGPVIPIVPDDAPAWIRRGRFYDFARLPTGTVVPLNRLRFGNVLLRGAPLRREPGPFDPRYGLTTGEDGDLLARMAHKGARIVWCDEATVDEPVVAARLSLRWLLQRSLSGGQEFARKALRGTYGPMGTIGRLAFFSRAFAQMILAAVLCVLTLPAGRHQAARWLLAVSGNLGKLTVFFGWTYREYA